MTLLSLSDISELLKDRKLPIVAQQTGISYSTLRNLRDKKSGNFTYEILLTISKYLKS